jgi:hypothetical protein
MRETVRHALLLLAMGMPARGVNVASAVQFVCEHALSPGGWCENPALHIPPFERSFLSNTRGVTWLTADALELLQQAGWGDSPVCRSAVGWLRAQQNAAGGWPSVPGEGDDRSDPDATAAVAFLLGELFGVDDDQFRRGRGLFERFLDETAVDAERGYRIRPSDGSRQEVEVYGLTHLLLSWLGDRPRRVDSGYDVSDQRVQLMMNALVACQWEDGGWRPFWAGESSALCAALAVKTLILTGALPKDELKRMALEALCEQ